MKLFLVLLCASAFTACESYDADYRDTHHHRHAYYREYDRAPYYSYQVGPYNRYDSYGRARYYGYERGYYRSYPAYSGRTYSGSLYVPPGPRVYRERWRY